MPNWGTTLCRVSGDQKEVARFAREILGHKGGDDDDLSFSFKRIIPSPEFPEIDFSGDICSLLYLIANDKNNVFSNFLSFLKAEPQTIPPFLLFDGGRSRFDPKSDVSCAEYLREIFAADGVLPDDKNQSFDDAVRFRVYKLGINSLFSEENVVFVAKILEDYRDSANISPPHVIVRHALSRIRAGGDGDVEKKFSPRYQPLVKADLSAGLGRLKFFSDCGYADWYPWRLGNWGVKWDAGEFCLLSKTDECIEFIFDTAWSFPEPVFVRLAEIFPSLRIYCAFCEPGMLVCGDGHFGVGSGDAPFRYGEDSDGSRFSAIHEIVYGVSESDFSEEIDDAVDNVFLREDNIRGDN